MMLDSDILIEFLRNNISVRKIISEIEKKESVGTTSINTFEIWSNALPKEKQIIEQFFKLIHIIEIDYETSKLAGEIFQKLKLKGKEIGISDCLIAASCILCNERLFTNNKKHFENIPSLKLY
jgi:predicted nucleic acid-binding protein